MPTTIDRPGVYEIPVTTIWLPGNHIALINTPDWPMVRGYRWRVLGGHNGKLYVHARVAKGQFVYMHRLLTGTAGGFETDHINGDGLDNRRVNLRVATASQNRANMGKPRRPDGGRATSRFKGVSWDKERSKWLAKIRSDGRHRNLGRFNSEVDAAYAYDSAAFAAWGEFARLNFPAEVAS